MPAARDAATPDEAIRAAEEWNATEADNGKTRLVAFVDSQGVVAAQRKRQRTGGNANGQGKGGQHA